MRIKILKLILLIPLFILLGALYYVQIIRHNHYKVMSEENRLKVVSLMAPRGTIFDRSGKVLVKDVLSFNASIIYSRVKDKTVLVEFLSKVLDLPIQKIISKVEESKRRPYSSFCIVSDIGVDKAIYLEEIGLDYPGVLLDISTKREYKHNKVASNILGYTGYLNSSEFYRLKQYGYRMNDLIGRSGIEKYYEEYLRGTHGGKQIEVDFRGREVNVMGYKEAVSGKDIVLTIDLKLQKFCDDLLQDRQGSIIVMDSNTGEILAMASAPSYDPNIFICSDKKEELRKVLNDNKYPLLNRAISGMYAPGSLFKLVVGLAALELNKINVDTVYNCPGFFSLGKFVFKCWKKVGHGNMSIKHAIKNSCNVYFYNVGLLIGVDAISEFAKKFGFGEKTGIDLPGEKIGIVPNPIWKRKRLKESWYKGDTVNYSIGQGYFLCTPIQLARMIACFANKGYLVDPIIAKKVGGITLNNIRKRKLNFSSNNIDIIRDGMRKVVNGFRGTGMKAKLEDIIISGKTGTAQTPKGIDHGWFGGFAPFENAQLVVIVFDEYGGKGGSYAAETASKVFKKAFELGFIKKI